MSYTKVGDNKYRIFVSDGFNLDGTRRRPSKTVETDLKGRDLEKFLTLAEFEFEDEVKKKDPKFKQLASGSFEEYSIWWLDYIEIDVAPKTKQEYEKLLNTRVINYIGKKALNKLTNGDMIELIKLIKESPAKTKSGKLSINSVKHYHVLLKKMFNDAYKLKIINENPMDNVSFSAPKAKLKNNYYNIDDVKKFLNCLSKEPIKHQLSILLALSTGARLGEIIGLEWKHIDLLNSKITIEQAASYTKERGCFVKSTKNTHSERSIAFPTFLIPLFEKHKKDELIKKEYTGHSNNFVFTQKDGRLMFLTTPSKKFQKIIEKNDLKRITFHGLRHTNTTISIRNNIDIVSISHLLGHSKTSTTTDFYAHALEDIDRKVANTFDNILESGSRSGSRKVNLRVVK